MDDYISREELRKHLKECYDDELFDPDMKKAVFGIDIYIENMPATDVRPVKHGRWIDHEMFERNNCNPCIECAICNTWIGCNCFSKTKFCPNCGARMDGDSKC